ncbi:MAG: rhodanese-like domain-containing protein [Proteobacteria bacterium]|nr:MAG: rhodanese-like domain-containing protein [Pseudomonadota bacterium]
MYGPKSLYSLVLIALLVPVAPLQASAAEPAGEAAAVTPAGQQEVIDVRTPEEFSESHVVGAQNIDVQNSSFKEQIQKLDKSKKYVLYCRSGKRSGKAKAEMKALGFKEVENFGSVGDAAKKLDKRCEGAKPSC